MHVYLDESGDLGWRFDRPYRSGGSSRYLSLAFLIVDQDTRKYPKRVIRKLRSKFKIPVSKEVKGSDLTPGQLLFFAEKASKLASTHDAISYCSITVRKKNVQEHIRLDPNKLYNYMINLCLLDLMKGQSEVLFTPDPRSIKVASGNSMINYLQMQLWFEKEVATKLQSIPSESHTNLNLQFVDVLAHIIWSYHEDSEREAYEVIAHSVASRHLYFH